MRANTKVLKFLKALKDSDFYIQHIYTNGGCFQLYKILKTIWPQAKPYTNTYIAHVATMIDGVLYDIHGRIKTCDPNEFMLMSKEQMEEAENWSFAGNNDLYYGECPICDEPIKIDREKLIRLEHDRQKARRSHRA